MKEKLASLLDHVNSCAGCSDNSNTNKLIGMEKTRRELTDEEKAAAKRLREIWQRKKGALNLTQLSMAIACGWSVQAAFQQYLNASIPLNVKALLKISRELKVGPE